MNILFPLGETALGLGQQRAGAASAPQLQVQLLFSETSCVLLTQNTSSLQLCISVCENRKN